MSYLTLGSACLLFSLQFIFSKWYELRTDKSLNAAIWMTVLGSVWLVVLFFPANGFSLRVTVVSAVFALLFSFLDILCTVTTLFSMHYGKVAIISLFMLTGGLVLPVVYGVAILGETLTLQKGMGIGLILLSFFPGTLFKKEPADGKRSSHNLRNFLLYLTVFISNGMISVVTKAHSINAHAAPETDFLIFAALLRFVMALTLIGSLAVRKKASSPFLPTEKPNRFIHMLPLFLIIGGYTICNGVANVFSMMTAKTMDSSFQFPVISAAVILMTALISWAVYKEKPSIGDTVGMAFTLGGIAFMVG